jgi:predicted ATPase
MHPEITVKNYRCFLDGNPVRLKLRKGFTALVGANNSGKSALLRFFYELRSLFHQLSVPNSSIASAYMGNPQTFASASSVHDLSEMFNNRTDRGIEIEVTFSTESQQTRPDLRLPTRARVTIPRGENTWQLELELTGSPINPRMGSFDVDGSLLRHGGTPIADLQSLFATFRSLARTVYVGPFRNAINLGATENYFDLSVGQAFISAWRTMKTGPNRAQNEATYRLTNDVARIFDFKSLEINPSSDDRTLQVFVNGRSYPASDLGSGLIHFILTLTAAAIARPAYVLIDEPELNLHPSLQLEFLTTLGSYATDGVIFATHSIGLARAAAEQVYSLRRIDDGVAEVRILETTPRLSEFLGELSYSGHRDLGFDKLLLVEGANDVRTIQQLLRLAGKDHRVVLLPLGGSQLINASREVELQEIKRIASDVYALIDSERTTEAAELGKDRDGFRKACEQAGIKCHILQRRSIENYLSDSAIKKVKGEKYNALGPYEGLESLNPTWSKSENWLIAREMTKDDLIGTDLAELLDSL